MRTAIATAPLAAVDLVLRIDDVCALLKISRTKFKELREVGWFGTKGPELIEITPAIDSNPRYRGEPFAQWLSRDAQDRNTRRAVMSAVR